MKIEEFFYWLKGFSEAVNQYNVTPKQWETILEKIDQVELKDEEGKKVFSYKYGGNTNLENSISKQLFD